MLYWIQWCRYHKQQLRSKLILYICVSYCVKNGMLHTTKARLYKTDELFFSIQPSRI